MCTQVLLHMLLNIIALCVRYCTCVCVLWLFAFVHTFSRSVNQPRAFTMCELMYGWLSREIGALCLKAESVIRGKQKRLSHHQNSKYRESVPLLKKSDGSVNI